MSTIWMRLNGQKTQYDDRANFLLYPWNPKAGIEKTDYCQQLITNRPKITGHK